MAGRYGRPFEPHRDAAVDRGVLADLGAYVDRACTSAAGRRSRRRGQRIGALSRLSVAGRRSGVGVCVHGVRLCVCLPACLPACVCLPVSLPACLCACVPACLRACLPVSASASVSVPVCLSLHIYVCVVAAHPARGRRSSQRSRSHACPTSHPGTQQPPSTPCWRSARR